MIAWTIEAAVKSKVFDMIMVSTDDKEISEIAQKYGAKVPFLRDLNRDDFSTVSDVVVHEKNRLKEEFDIVVMLMPNCPIRDEFDIRNSVSSFIEKGRDFQISCFKYGWMNPWWAHKINSSGEGESIFTKEILSRSQDLEDLYCPTGAIWVASTKALDKEKTFYGKNFTMEPLDWKKAVDIDDYNDLEMANFIFSFR